MLYSIPVATSQGEITAAWLKDNLPAYIGATILAFDADTSIFSTPRLPGKALKIKCSVYTMIVSFGDWVSGVTLENEIQIKGSAAETPNAAILVVSPTAFAIVERYNTNEAAVSLIALLDNDQTVAFGLKRSTGTGNRLSLIHI